MIFLMVIETEADKEKLKNLYARYRRLMYKIAFEILNNHGDVEDVLHDSFVKVANKMEFIGETDAKETRNFLAVITKNTAIDLYRKKQRKWKKEVNIKEVRQEQLSKTYMQNGNEEAQTVIEAIHNLPEMYREVLSLKYTNQFSIKEISKILNISETNVKQRIFRAKNLLKEEIQKRGR